MDAGVEATGVRRSFGPVHAVRDISLTAHPGEITALVGPNGAGKTTLLLMLATLLVPDAGSIRIVGHDPVAEPYAVRERIGWTPDVFGVYDNLTAGEYLRFFGAGYRLGTADARRRAVELLELARLSEFADAPVHVLSRGQKQRLGLVRALMHNPSVLMLDEPASGLDPHSRVALRSLLRQLAGEGKTVIVSSHILADLEETADRVVFIDQGRTVGEHRMADLPRAASRAWRIKSLDAGAVFALTVGTLIAFGLALSMTTEQVTRTVRVPVGDPFEPGQRPPQYQEQTVEITQTRSDRVWWLLAPNPFVVLADAAPTLPRRIDPMTGRPEQSPLDPLGEIGGGVRLLRNPPAYDGFGSTTELDEPSPPRPVWPYGLAFNVVLGAVALAVTTRRLRTPSRNLPRGIRVA